MNPLQRATFRCPRGVLRDGWLAVFVEDLADIERRIGALEDCLGNMELDVRALEADLEISFLFGILRNSGPTQPLRILV